VAWLGFRHGLTFCGYFTRRFAPLTVDIATLHADPMAAAWVAIFYRSQSYVERSGWMREQWVCLHMCPLRALSVGDVSTTDYADRVVRPRPACRTARRAASAVFGPDALGDCIGRSAVPYRCVPTGIDIRQRPCNANASGVLIASMRANDGS
jgi:hypothetical protein